MYSTYFQEWLSETFKPCVLVYSTDLAKNSIKKNNLSPADFLRPLGDFTGKKIDTPFPESEIMSFINFQIDFYDNDKFKSIKKIEIQKYINTMFDTIAPKWDLSNILLNKNKKNIIEYISKMKYYSSKYFTEYEKTLFECLYFDENELYQQPLINILICSSLDEPSTIINLLNTKENIPELILKQIYDPAQENLLMILNDLSDENYNKLSEEEKEQNINKFKLKFSNYSIINMDINGEIKDKNKDNTKKISDFYKKYFHRLDIYNPYDNYYRREENIYGTYITNENIIKYKDNFYKYFNFFMKNNFIHQINRYLEIIQNNSGIKNFLTSFSGFSPFGRKEEISYYPNTKIYKLSELERAYYNLGLINFYFRNYSNALEYFKVLKGMINNKSIKFRERIKELFTMCKYITIYVDNEFNFVNEMISEGTLEQIIRNELIIIKMYENNEELYPMIENILNFILATKDKFIKEDKSQREGENKKEEKNSFKNYTCFKYLYPLLYEKIAIYYISHNYYRKFQMFMSYTGEFYNALPENMKIYSLNSFSNLLSVLDNIDSSFLNLKLFYNNKLSKICKNLKLWESYFKFSKNCFELLIFETKKKNNEMETKIIENYLDSVNYIKTNNIICTNTELNYLEIPQIDNSSLFLLEENDYKIKLATKELKEIYKKENIKNCLTWLEFNKYSNKLVENYYVYLIEQDLNIIKMLYDLGNRKLGEMVNIKNRNFFGNPNQKLYVNINIKNPLSINLKLSSMKLNCDFFPDKKIPDSQTISDFLKFSEANITLKSYEDINLLLTVNSTISGQMIVNGIDFIIYDNCHITHLFSKKNRKRLYIHRPKYLVKYIEDDENYKNLKANNGNEEKIEKSYIVETRRRMSSMFKKKKIEYYIYDLNDDLYISFPKGNIIDVYLYQFILFPISITNNSKNVKIKRFSIFLENSDEKKIKTFFKYITKKIYINPKHNNEIVLIPFIPLSLGEIFIKIIIKFEDEIRVKPVEIKRSIIKINVKESISFDFKEICSNFSINKNKNIFDSYDILNFNIKTDVRIKNTNLYDLTLDKPIFNPKKYNLLDIKEDLVNKEEIHRKYTLQKFYLLFDKDNNNENKNIEYKFDFIKEDFEKSNVDLKTNEHIIEKLNKTLNNINNNIFFFPWNVYEKKNNQMHKINGLYPYNISLKGPKPTKKIIRELFFNSTQIEIVKQKIDSKRTLIAILLTLNKKELITFNNVIDKYDIYVNNTNPEINWIGTQRYTIKNILDDNKDKNIFKCRFCFITTLKGMVEVNRLSVLLYKKVEIKQQYEAISIEHISKPLSIYLD